jgi:membrane-associated phospholipid phosphatase
LSLGLSLCLALLAFKAADDWAHGYLQISFIAGMTVVMAIGFMLPMPSLWSRIEMRDPNVALQQRVLVLLIVFLVLFVGTSAIAGRAIGTTGREAGQLLADSEERRTLGKAIARVRASTEGSIPSQIAMYKEIGSDVDRFDVVLHRLEVELPIYDRKFPSRHSSTLTTLSWVLTDLKRNEFLKQQIQVAATIESADLPTQQKAWREQMQPLLDAEAEYVPSKY